MLRPISSVLALLGGVAMLPAYAQEAETPPASQADEAPVATQEAPIDPENPPQRPSGPPESVLDGDYITIGLGAALLPSYDGSDDYQLSVLPLLQGSLGGISINPRPAGVALDFISDGEGDGPNFAFGPVVRIRSNRNGDVEDDVVALLPERDTAVELGASAGVSLSKVIHQFDSLSFSVDTRWDVAGAHDGMSVSGGVSYLTPLSQGIVAILGVSTEYADDDFMDYYYTITPGDAASSGLAPFQANGGFRSAGVNLLMGFDLNGNVLDGGFSIFALGGYTRLLGDAADSPITSVRGSADQLLVGTGIAYTF